MHSRVRDRPVKFERSAARERDELIGRAAALCAFSCVYVRLWVVKKKENEDYYVLLDICVWA